MKAKECNILILGSEDYNNQNKHYNIFTFSFYKYYELFEIGLSDMNESQTILTKYIKNFITKSEIAKETEIEINFKEKGIINIEFLNIKYELGESKIILMNQIVLISTIMALIKLERTKYKINNDNPIIVNKIHERLDELDIIKLDNYIEKLKLKQFKQKIHIRKK